MLDDLHAVLVISVESLVMFIVVSVLFIHAVVFHRRDDAIRVAELDSGGPHGASLKVAPARLGSPCSLSSV